MNLFDNNLARKESLFSDKSFFSDRKNSDRCYFFVVVELILLSLPKVLEEILPHNI